MCKSFYNGNDGYKSFEHFNFQIAVKTFYRLFDDRKVWELSFLANKIIIIWELAIILEVKTTNAWHGQLRHKSFLQDTEEAVYYKVIYRNQRVYYHYCAQKTELEKQSVNQIRSHEWRAEGQLRRTSRLKMRAQTFFSNPFPRVKLASNHRFNSVITYHFNKIVYHSRRFFPRTHWLIRTAILWAGSPEGDAIPDSIFKNNTNRQIEHARELGTCVFQIGNVLYRYYGAGIWLLSLLTAVIDVHKYRESSASLLDAVRKRTQRFY